MSDKEFGGAEDLSLPKATVQKIISEILPQLPQHDASLGEDMAFTKGARDLLIQCSMEFLRMLSSEANDISEKESKKTIAVEHVEQALKDLGFPDYIEGIKGVVGEWKQVQTKRTNRTEKMKTYGGLRATDEELAQMQAALFGEAKDRMEGGEPSSAA
ncbi:negative cofactor 2 transcription regulator complex subunit ncb2 [Knufia fluminis]|uniref:NCT transcriptional regulatory complex subunit B n=1 Tax=Knufia fluminis TaxID=191047 RepID=A0AAN8I540_9EURO|nr:negative cofactor 2 transcription regulator complex subunit ncb2 [Knufia fluminis]